MMSHIPLISDALAKGFSTYYSILFLRIVNIQIIKRAMLVRSEIYSPTVIPIAANYFNFFLFSLALCSNFMIR